MLNKKIQNLLVAIAAAVLSTAATADSFTYVSNRRLVRAGIINSSAQNIVVAGQNLGSENPDPHLFFIADQREDLKPSGMEFINPLAPPVITGDIYERWRRRVRAGFVDPAFDPASPVSRLFQPGAKLTKNMGAYWEVNIDNLSVEDLRQYDILYLHSHANALMFTKAQSEKLRQYVDRGGTLWVENCGRMGFAPTAPFLFDVQMHSGANNTAGAVIGAPNHPLLTTPYAISAQELQTIGDKRVNDYYLFYPYDVTNPAFYDANGGIDSQNPPGAHTLQPIVWNTRGFGAGANNTPNPRWRPYWLGGQVGAGRILYTSQDTGCSVNDYVGGANAGYGGNSGAISGELTIAAHPVDLKFLYNLASWSTAQSTSQVDVRRTGSTAERIGSVLETKWNTHLPGTPFAKVSGAVVYKNAVFAVDGDLVLHAYDPRPGQDLDGDGNPDDGLPDLIGGAAFDELWRVDLKPFYSGGGNGRGCSAPTVIEFFDPNGDASPVTNGLLNYKNRELVVVVLSDGTVVAVRAFPRQLRNVFGYSQPVALLAPFSNVDWALTGATTPFTINGNPMNNLPHSSNLEDNEAAGQDRPIPGVAFSEGVLFIGVNTSAGGRVIAVDPRNGRSALRPGPDGYSGQPFNQAMVPNAPGTASVTSSPTVGYVRDLATDAIDKIVYVTIDRAPAAPASIRAFWWGTRNEPLSTNDPAPNAFRSRAQVPWHTPDSAPADFNYSLRPRLVMQYTDPATGAVSVQELAYVPGGGSSPGANQFTVTFAVPNIVRIYVGNVQGPGMAAAVAPKAPGVQLLADYTLDWAPLNPAFPRLNTRSILNVVDPINAGNMITGSPVLGNNDRLFYTADLRFNVNNNEARGGLFSVNEQGGGQSQLNWAYTLHNGFSTVADGQVIEAEPSIRQMDSTQPGFGQYVGELKFFGSPVVKDGVVYAVARGILGQFANVNPTQRGFQPSNPMQPVNVLLAFKAEPDLVLRLLRPITPGTAISVSQFSFVSRTGGGQLQLVRLDPSQYTVDYESGTIRLKGMAAKGNVTNYLSVNMPFFVQIPNQPNQVILGRKTNIIGGVRQDRVVGPEGIDNLLWYVTIPAGTPIPAQFTNSGTPVTTGWVSSSPTIVGDSIWLGFQGFGGGVFNSSVVMSLDTDPKAREPEFQSGNSAVRLVRDVAANAPGHMRWARNIGTIGGTAGYPAILQAPSAYNNVLVTATYQGVQAFEDTLTLIADNRRLVEINAAGEVVWSVDGTRTYGVAGGELPQFVPGAGGILPANPLLATGVVASQRIPFSRPSVAKRISANEMVVVDTGNNRVVQIDRGGNTAWEISKLNDQFKSLLRPGDPLTLNEPTDASVWTEFNPAMVITSTFNGVSYSYSGPAVIIHYLIADSGNFRVVELVDVYDATGRPVVLRNGGSPAPFDMLRQVNFVTATYGGEGKRYRYRSVQDVPVLNKDLPAQWQDSNRGPNDIVRLKLAAVSNYRLVGAATSPLQQAGAGGDTGESTGGSLVLLDETTGKPLSIVSNLRIPDATQPNGFRLQPIVNPTWLSKFEEVVTVSGSPRLVFKYLLADANGCYQIYADPQDPSAMAVEWLLTGDAYFQMTGKRLSATSIRRLVDSVPNPLGIPRPNLRQFLITNKFRGGIDWSVFGFTFPKADFAGEAFVISPETFDITKLTGPTAGDPRGLYGYLPDWMPGMTGPVPFSGLLGAVPLKPSIIWRSPKEEWSGTIFRRFIGDPSTATATQLLEQPTFADRPF